MLETAETLSAKQKDISVSEFFAKNRHLLGFDSPRKAILTTVKEAVDNSLDACEDAGILPFVAVVIEDLEPDRKSSKQSRYRVTVIDNGPGIVRKQVENVFGRLLFGSKFHRLRMSRGQQGIGISAAGMYGLMTTGRPMIIHTRPNAKKPAHHIELAINTKTNRAEVTVDSETTEFPPSRFNFLDPSNFKTGTSVSIVLEGRYTKGKGSIDEFLELTAIANPHATIVFVEPEEHTITTYERSIEELPRQTQEVLPHPYGVEIGTFMQMRRDDPVGTPSQFLTSNFSGISEQKARELVVKVGGTISTFYPELFALVQAAKLPPPPTDCLAPIGVRQLLGGLLGGLQAEFYAASTRDPAIYSGRPFQIEAAIAFGGELPPESPARVIRFANRVPLLFSPSGCSSFHSVLETNWKKYGLTQPRDSLPTGPLVIMIHIASVWVPFTSESKEAIANFEEITKEMKLALMECGRKLALYLKRRQRMEREAARRDIFQRYVGEVAKALAAITGQSEKALAVALLTEAQRRTALVDAQLDEEGRIIKKEVEELKNDPSVMIVEKEVPDGEE